MDRVKKSIIILIYNHELYVLVKSYYFCGLAMGETRLKVDLCFLKILHSAYSSKIVIPVTRIGAINISA
jgi:hypothetical protein